MKSYRVTVFEKHTYEVKAKDEAGAMDKVLSGEVKRNNAELDGMDIEEIK